MDEQKNQHISIHTTKEIVFILITIIKLKTLLSNVRVVSNARLYIRNYT